MRDKSSLDEALRRAGGADRRQQIRSDLEARGVARAVSGPAAHRLLDVVSELSEAGYAAVLDGVAAASGANREPGDPDAPDAAELREMQRLMEGFATELGKLEEGLQMLSAYVVRMSERSGPTPGKTLH